MVPKVFEPLKFYYICYDVIIAMTKNCKTLVSTETEVKIAALIVNVVTRYSARSIFCSFTIYVCLDSLL